MQSLLISALDCLAKNGPLTIHEAKEEKEVLAGKYRLIKPHRSQAELALTLKLPLLQLSSFVLCLR